MKRLKKNVNHYDAIIFDLDGTLIDSMWIWDDIDEVYLKDRGFVLPKDLKKSIEGMSVDEVAYYFKERFNLKENIDEMKHQWSNMARDYYKNKIKLKAGVSDFLNGLSEKNKKLAIGTSNFLELTELVLESNNIKSFFQTIKTSNDVGKGKPEPDLFLKLAEELGVIPEKCLVFEDTHSGVIAAKRAGMDVYSVFDEASRPYMEEIKSDSIDMIFSYPEFAKEFLK